MRNLVIISLVIAMASCSMMQPARPVQVRTIAERPPMFHPPLPMEVQLDPVDTQ